MTQFIKINVGSLIQQLVTEKELDICRICNFLHCNEKEIVKMYKAKSLDTEVLLRWSKLLEYDFFRIYTQHLILYAPPSLQSEKKKKSSLLPVFRKNIYTREIVEFILGEISSGIISKQEVIDKYRIPKTTLYKWIKKYKVD